MCQSLTKNGVPECSACSGTGMHKKQSPLTLAAWGLQPKPYHNVGFGPTQL